ncbi:acetyltransferase [Candidatus Electrothrix sp.]|uniref:acetyltransferase n=1 Tax=Candidatus Electrothrix sp. TaxID=2170559 RepID=UPI004056BB61
MSNIYAVYGASGFGREVMPLARKMLPGDNDAKLVFIDDGKAGEIYNGYEVIGFENFLRSDQTIKKVCLAIADSSIRKELFDKLEESQVEHWSVFAQNVVILDGCRIGENSVLAPFVTLTSNISVGKSFHANLYSYVGHDCVIGDFVTFAPGVKCNGNVKIEDNVYIGSGAIIKQGKPGKPLVIGEGAAISMGAIVSKNVPAGALVVATPSKKMQRKERLGG